MSLLSLPPELLDQICKEFCLHCQKAPSHPKFYFNIADQNNTPPETKSLVALRRTCTVLAQIAQPYLYHRPLGQRFPSFVQNVSEYPQLGHRVRHLSVAQATSPCIRHGDLCAFFTHGFVDRFLERCHHMRGTKLYEDARKCYLDPMPKLIRRCFCLRMLDTFDDEREALAITFGLSFMPNLTKLEILLGENWIFRWCRPDSLPCLRKLVISERDLRRRPNGLAIYGLLAAAPALERLELNEVVHILLPKNERSYLSHANLKELVINASTISTPSLHMLMNGFPNLQTFRFGWAYWKSWHLLEWEETPCPSILNEVVLRRKDTLRHLSLDLSETGDMGGEKLQDLSKMTVLETLHIDSLMLTDENGEVPNDQEIHDILPPNIKEFGLMGKAYKRLYEEVLHLITMRHENLQKVIVASEDLQKDEWSLWINVFASACSETNIEFSTQKPSHWKALTNPNSDW
ncbi:hypothetical protein NW752_010238 [Fusarium irregulare]|uniref:F-box domain-containing protein n=1 Tax=Fusarium irregulare TaxID=2494466 RepID=A0A9W8U7L0_9HYPO|nr:hypothetical protein NW752_010238 [Fusarium irregulare]KAJ4007875.1 hypothetical protein NW766_009686 [Fusarium irregulare]